MIYINMILFPIIVAIIIQLICYIVYYFANVKIHKSFYPTKEIPSAANLNKNEILSNLKLLYLHGKIRFMYITEEYVSFEDNSPLLMGNVYYIRFQEPNIISYRGAQRVYRVRKKKLEEITLFFSL